MNTRKFLLDLLDPKKTPKVPKAIRDQARMCLKHFPDDWHMERAGEENKVFGYPED